MVGPLRVVLRVMHGGGPFEGSFFARNVYCIVVLLRVLLGGPFEGSFFTRNAWWALLR